MAVPIKVIQERRGEERVDIHPQTSIEAVVDLQDKLDEKANQSALTQEITARKSADDGIYGRITELNKDLDDETAKRTNSDTGLLQAITAEENARKSLTDTYHKNQITPITPPDFEFSGIAEFGNGLTNTIEIVFNKVSSLSAATKIGHTDFKPVAQVDLPVRSAFNGEIGGFIETSGDIFIWSSYGHQIVASLGGIVVTYVVRRR